MTPKLWFKLYAVQATHEIRKLSSEKHDLELEMEKLLEANVELATESKKLLGNLH